MKMQNTSRPGGRGISRQAGACFGFFALPRSKTGRPAARKGLTTVIAGPRGIYFLPTFRA
jgi:hypothetical protein